MRNLFFRCFAHFLLAVLTKILALFLNFSASKKKISHLKKITPSGGGLGAEVEVEVVQRLSLHCPLPPERFEDTNHGKSKGREGWVDSSLGPRVGQQILNGPTHLIGAGRRGCRTAPPITWYYTVQDDGRVGGWGSRIHRPLACNLHKRPFGIPVTPSVASLAGGECTSRRSQYAYRRSPKETPNGRRECPGSTTAS